MGILRLLGHHAGGVCSWEGGVTVPNKEEFSLMRGGPTWRLLRPLERFRRQMVPARLITLLLLLLTIVPIAVLAALESSLLPGDVALPMAGDWFVLARFLLAMPVLVLAARFSDRMLGHAMRQFHGSEFISADTRPQAERVFQQALRARDAPWAELICLALAFVPAFMGSISDAAIEVGLSQESYWRYTDTGELTAAGAWMKYVAGPVFRFILLLWLWRFVLWTWMLLQFSRLPLSLRATHPDGACGLAFLGLAQSRFATVAAAGALVICGNCINQMVYGGMTITDFQYLIAGYVIISMFVLMGPLLLLSVKLARTRRRDMAIYDIMGQRLFQAFDRQWKGMDSAPESDMLNCPSPQTAADFSAVHGNIRATAIVPVNRWHLLRMALAALLPFTPMLFIAMSVDELMKRIMSVLM